MPTGLFCSGDLAPRAPVCEAVQDSCKRNADPGRAAILLSQCFRPLVPVSDGVVDIRPPAVAMATQPQRSPRLLAGPGLDVVGFVPDLTPWFERCRVSVSPLRYGAGIKGKVNHAMSHGLPVVATRASIEGMHLAEGEEVLVADDADAFVDAVVRLYGDEVLWNRLSAAGIANVERHFSTDVAARGLERLFEIAERRAAAATGQRITSASRAG